MWTAAAEDDGAADSTRITEPLLDVLSALLEAHDWELHGYAIIKGDEAAAADGVQNA